MNIDEKTQGVRYVILQPTASGWRNKSGETYLASKVVKIAKTVTIGTVLYLSAEHTREVVPYTVTKDNNGLVDLLTVLAKARIGAGVIMRRLA
jgi:hypothetical protein